MTITIELSTEQERALQRRAEVAGQDLNAFVHEPIDRGIQSRPSLDELLAPIRREFADSGMTDDDLETLVRQAREEIWSETEARSSRAS